MEVTHVIRGDDHIPNTPRQLLIYEALKTPPPQFAHMPLMLGQDRGKLSKRHGALSIMAYREMGFLPQALMNYLARLGWSHGDQEIFSRGELMQYFSLEHATKAAGVFDLDKLLWLNSHYLKETPAPELAQLLKPFLAPLGIAAQDPLYLSRVASTLNARSKTLVDMAEKARFYFQDPRPFEEAAARKFLTPQNAPHLKEIARRLQGLTEVSAEALNSLFNQLAAQTGLKMVNLAQPVRVALTGRTASPGLFEIINILGKEETLKRLNNALSFIQT
jgi:glutamyl-tRNA synthetase